MVVISKKKLFNLWIKKELRGIPIFFVLHFNQNRYTEIWFVYYLIIFESERAWFIRLLAWELDGTEYVLEMVGGIVILKVPHQTKKGQSNDFFIFN